MGRGLGFIPSEDEFIIDNADKLTAKELFELHENLREDMVWQKRSLKSLARRVERLRELELIGLRLDDRRRRAYFTRVQSQRIRAV